MKMVLAGNAVTLEVPLVDANGIQINAQAVTFSVSDETGKPIITDLQVMPFTSGQQSVSITIGGGSNNLPPIDLVNAMPSSAVVRGARNVTITCHFVGGETQDITLGYFIEPADLLIPGVNSFQSYMQAQINAFDLPNIDHFNAADQRTRSVALIEAATRIRRLRFDFCAVVGSSSFVFKSMRGSLDFVNTATFLQFPDYFLRSLRLAQLVEANYILGGESDRRDDGVLLESAGDAKVMYRSGVKLRTAICREALQYLNRYTQKGLKIGRG